MHHFRIAIAALLVAFVLGSEPALAQIELEVFLPREDNPDEFAPANQDRIERFFNLSRCLCGSEFGVEFFLPVLESVPDSRPIEVWLGNSCDDQELQLANCGPDPIATFADRDAIRNPSVLTIPVNELADPINGQCRLTETTPAVYALIDETGDGTYEVNDSLGIFVDLNPPPALARAEARGAEGGFVVEWELPSARQDDFETFQVLCAKADGTPARDSASNDPTYETPVTVCNATVSIPVDGGVGEPLTGIDALDPRYVCGSATVPADSIRVSDLADDPDGYRVILLAIDRARNPTLVDFGTVVPQPVQDFWEDYKDRGGGAEGGYCFVATAAYGDYNHPHVVVLRHFRDEVLAQTSIGRALVSAYYAISPPLAALIGSSRALRFATRVALAPIVVGAGMWVYSGTLGHLGIGLAFVLAFALIWHRRRRRRPEPIEATRPVSSRHKLALAAAAAAAVFLFAIGGASAQQEYLDELTEDPVPAHLGGVQAVKWNMEFRVGPFVPDVDSEFSGVEEGPFKEMFGGGPMLMSKVSLDRFFLYPEGQLGATFSLGFLTTGADSYALDEMGNVRVGANGKKIRAKGERTNLRLFPLTAGGVYRYTGLEDHFHIPVVPYGKLALAYTIWTITKPSGSAAEVPTPDCPDIGADCSGDVARGGSLGFDATLGIAVRAERIDPDASVSLRNEMGIEHAGFFAEMGYSKVDGFGSDKKLSVGDLTFFGGFNFEF